MNDDAAPTTADGRYDSSFRNPFKAAPDALTVFIWTPGVLALILYMTDENRFFHSDAGSRLMPLGLPAIISTLVCLFLATVCFQKGSRRIQTLVFGAICALWGFLNLDITLLFILKDKDTALLINRIDHSILVFQLGLCSHYFHSLTAMKKRTVLFAYGLSFFYVPLTLTPYYLKGMHEYPWGLFGSRGFLFDVLMGVTLTVISFGSRALIRQIRTLEKGSIEKKQVVFSFAGIISMAMINLANIPAMSGIDFFPFGTFIFVPMLVLIYGVVRYDVVKINAYFKKRFWVRVAMALTGTGYLFLAVLIYETISGIPTQDILTGLFPSGLPLLISLATCLFFSFLALRVGPTLTGTRLFGLICMILAYLSADILLNQIVTNPDTGLRISRFCHIFLVMWPPLCVHLVSLVCRKKTSPVLVSSYVAGICFALSTHSAAYLPAMSQYPWGFFAQRGPIFDLFCALALFQVVYCVKTLHRTAAQKSPSLATERLTLFSISIGASTLFALGNLPAMWGFDIYPAGNFIFIPLILFGFAMFRNNLKEVLTLMNRIVFLAGLIVLFGTVSIIIRPFRAGHSSFTVFSILIIGFYLLRLVEWSWGSALSYVFDRQKKKLDVLHAQLTDRLSRTKSVDEIVDAVWHPVFSEIQTLRLTLLFHDIKQDIFLEISRLNPYFRNTFTENSQLGHLPPDIANHPLLSFYSAKRHAVTQEQVETWIADSDTVISRDDMMRKADIVQAVHWEGSLVCLLLFYGKADGASYSTLEKEFITRTGYILGPYIENAKRLQSLEKDIERRTSDLSSALTEITLINHFIKSASASLNLEDILSALYNLLSPIFRFDAVLVQLRDQDHNKLHLAKVHGTDIDTDIKKKLESLSTNDGIPESLCARCAGTGERAYIKVYRKDNSASFENSIHDILSFTSILVLPMEIRHDIIGNLILLSYTKPLEMTDKDLEKLQGYVNQVATAVNNARLYDKAEAAAMVKSDFLSRMSHEIRSPLNAILGMGESLSDSSLDSEQRACVETLLNSGGLLLSIINGILDFSKIEDNRLSVETIPFDLYALMKDIKDMVHAVAMKKNLNIMLSLSPDTPRHVQGDPFKLSQILINLSDNAIRFTDHGSIVLRVHSFISPSGQRMITFSVEDTGIGIPSEKFSEIFESFSQAESSTTRKYGGTGLGLAISRKLSQIMGGTLSVSSTPGQGSRFDVTLPMIEISDPSEQNVPIQGLSVLRLKSTYEIHNDQDISGTQSMAPFSVLVAEDLKTNVQVVRHSLKGLPFEMDVVNTGIKAVEAFQGKSYDIILMDLHMPGMDGYAAAKHIRTLEKTHGRTRRIPIIALTAYADGHSGNDGHEIFDDFLIKPFTRQDLVPMMTRLLRNRDTLNAIPQHLIPIIRVLTDEISEELENMEAALLNSDFQTVLRLSHGFKGAAGNCGLTDLVALFKHLHDHAEAGDVRSVNELIEAIRHQTACISVQ